MLTAEEPNSPIVEENKNEKTIEKIENDVKQAENEDKESINIEKVKEEIEETKQELEKLELDNHKDNKDSDDEEIVIPPPPEFSVPLFTKYIHGRQRSVSVSSEISNDSYLYEDTGNSPNLTLDSSGESIINADAESIVNTEISVDTKPINDEKHEENEEENEEEEIKDDDTIKDVPRDVQTSIPIITQEVVDDFVKIDEPKPLEKKNPELTVVTDETHLNTGNHVPPPRSSASLSASVTRQEGIQGGSRYTRGFTTKNRWTWKA